MLLMNKIYTLFLVGCLFAGSTLRAQQVLLQGWYWDYPKTADGKSWADTLRLKAAALKQAGITHIWFPPHAVASSGTGSNGYDPKDLFIGNQTTGLGTRPALNSMLAEFTSQGIEPVADLVLNHRDGGRAEVNPAVKSYITDHYTAAKEPFPSDRYRVILPLGGSSGNGSGDYYFKISSKTGDGRFFNYGYKVYMETKTRGFQGLAAQSEAEPNGGGDCGQGNNAISLGRDMLASVDAFGCRTDEFHLTLAPGDFSAAGDTLYIYLTNTGGYSDHRIYGLYSAPRGADIAGELLYQTYTDFTGLPSGRGGMNFEFFKPNSSNASTTFLAGDWDAMFFYYDYDQFQARTRDSLINYTKWNWTDLGVRGLRLDAVKHFTPALVGDILDDMHQSGMNPSMVVGEWYSTNASELSSWVNGVKAAMEPSTQAAIQPKIFDFTLRENLRQACDDGGFDVRNVFNGSLRDAAGMSGFNVVTFVNNHDFRDANGFASLIKNNPQLAYAYILTNNQLGVPTIFYPDYYGYPAPSGGQYGYHPTGLPAYENVLKRLMQVLKSYVNGSPGVDYLNRFSTPYSSNFISGSSNRALIYQLQGHAGNGNRDVIVAINFSGSSLKVDHQINNRGGSIGQGTRFTDVLGYSAFPFAVVNSSGQIYMDLPPNSFSVWVQGDLTLLPLRLQAFEAVAADNEVKLNWQVGDNQEALRFEVERSTDGLRFVPAGTVAGNGRHGVQDYLFTDRNAPRNTDLLYRLRLVSKDGTTRYSDQRRVRLSSRSLEVRVGANPAGRQLQLQLSGADAPLFLRIVNGQGQEMYTARVQAGTTAYMVPLDNWAQGIYQLVVQMGEDRKVISFIKK
jgi:hypothetical protein